MRIGRWINGAHRRSPREMPNALRGDVDVSLLDGRTKPAGELVRGDLVIVEAGGVIPCDGTVIEGLTMVDESTITGESAAVLREADSDRAAVIAGTRVLTSRIVIRV